MNLIRYYEEKAAEPLVLDGEAWQQLVQRLRRKARMLACWSRGGHELYRAHSESRIYQQCLCGHETAGWTIDRRDRRMALVVGNRLQGRRR